MSVQALPSTPSRAEQPAARRSGSGVTEDARDVFALPVEADAKDKPAAAIDSKTAETTAKSETPPESKGDKVSLDQSRVAFEAALALTSATPAATTEGETVGTTEHPAVTEAATPKDGAAAKDTAESKPEKSSKDETKETANGSAPIPTLAVTAAIETQAVIALVVPTPSAASVSSEPVLPSATAPAPAAITAKQGSSVVLPAIPSVLADKAVATLAQTAMMPAATEASGSTTPEGKTEPAKAEKAADGAGELALAKLKDASASPATAFAPEFKALDALKAAEPIDLSSLNLHGHPARGEAPKVAGLTLPDPAAGLAGQPSPGQAAALPTTPMHAVPIEIGLKALSGLNSFEIRLDPAELGRVDVKLDISDSGEVKARLVVDRVETLHLLQRDARTLERAFEQAGLKPSDAGVDISLRDQGTQSGYRQAPQQDEQPKRQTRQAATETDEMAVGGVTERAAPRWLRLGGVDLSV